MTKLLHKCEQFDIVRLNGIEYVLMEALDTVQCPTAEDSAAIIRVDGSMGVEIASLTAEVKVIGKMRPHYREANAI